MYHHQTIVQIGSHIGNTSNDPIFHLVDETTRLVLVEPVPSLFATLKDNYTTRFPNHPHLIFINKAVSSFVGTIELTVPSDKNDFNTLPFWANQLSSVHRDHAQKHIEGLITETITVPTTTISEIIQEHQINTIDLLHIDTEGHDFIILMNYDFHLLPKEVMFECKHMSDEQYETLSTRLVGLGYSNVFKNYEDAKFALAMPNHD
uniref:Methyltransferase FkbM domain-containing protein n=1 Tax=viral metagenome TaxID=1070528 RepID=A0A6C0K2S5_9ZZZZ